MWYKNGQTYEDYGIRQANPQVSFPTPITDELAMGLGYLKVVETPQPTVGVGQIVSDGGVELIDGVPARVWKVESFVPQSITPRQARLVLLQYNLLDDIEAMIATDRELGIWWEYSLDIKRDDERLLIASMALGITPEQLDQMFIEASAM